MCGDLSGWDVFISEKVIEYRIANRTRNEKKFWKENLR